MAAHDVERIAQLLIRLTWLIVWAIRTGADREDVLMSGKMIWEEERLN
jgi:hypothetical protein